MSSNILTNTSINTATTSSGVDVEKINAVFLEVSAWSGGTSLRKEDLQLEHLPERAFHLGRKYLIAPEKLNPFPTIRHRARQRCLKQGTRFLGGFALPQDDAAMSSLIADLEDMKREYNEKVVELLADLGRSIDEWVSEPEVQPYEQLIRASIPSKKSIERKFCFRYTIFKVGSPENAPHELLQTEAAQLPQTLFGEISEGAKELAESFLTRNARANAEKEEWTFNSKTIGAVKGLHKKLKGLQFLAPEIPPVVKEIEQVLSGLPESGHVVGDGMKNLYSLLLILSDEDRMRSLGKGLLAVSHVVAEEFPTPKVVQQAPVVEEVAAEPEAVLEADAAEEEPEVLADEEFEIEEVEPDEPEIAVPQAPSLFGKKSLTLSF